MDITSSNICVSISSTNFLECEQAMLTAKMAELRLDLMQLHVTQIEKLLQQKIPTVVTCREGKYNRSERLELLRLAIQNGASYVDIEVEAEESYRKSLIEIAQKHRCKAIISYHNFDCTPSHSELRNIISSCHSMGAAVVKLITAAQSAQDSARILSLYETEKNLVAFAMGEAGKITRLACLYLGAPFTYASMGAGKEAAAGQMTAESMKEIVRIMS